MFSWDNRSDRGKGNNKTRRGSRPPAVEQLEDRCVLSTASGAVTGEAFIDRNGDGLRNNGELGVAGATVVLSGTTTQGTAVNVSVVADGDGQFHFDNVLPGSYSLSAAAMPGLVGTPSLSYSFEGLGSDQLLFSTATTSSTPPGMVGLSPYAISLRDFLSSTVGGSPFGPGGSGQGLANYRANSAPQLATALPQIDLGKSGATAWVDMAAYFTDPDTTNSTVRFNTTAGPINVTLFDTTAPQTVSNFFTYLTAGKYDDTIFHRLETSFVLQGGGFSFDPTTNTLVPVAAGPSVKNEFGASNALGTLAMAKLPNQPDSATDEFFFNLAANTSLDTTNGGYTVFGQVAGSDDQAVLSSFASLYTPTDFSNGDPNSPFQNVPMTGYTGTNFPTDATTANFARLLSIDIVNRDEWLTYSVDPSSVPAGLTAAFTGSQLALTATPGQEGTAALVVTATDRYGATVTGTLNVAYGDRPPSATVQLSPTNPGVTDTVTATVTGSDPDGDPVTLNYSWKVNGHEVQAGSTTDASTTLDLRLSDVGAQVGDTVELDVTPTNDKTGAVASQSVTVVDHPPVVSNAQILNTFPSPTDKLTVQATASDQDGDPFTLNYTWKVNGQTVKSVTDSTSDTDVLDPSTLVPGTINEGDTVTVDVTPVDQNNVPGSTVTASVKINSAPTAETISDQAFSGQGPYSFNAANSFHDADTDQTLDYTAKLANGDPLPAWLSISTDGVLSGNPGDADAGPLNIVITATDPGGKAASASFTLTVSAGDTGLDDPPAVTSVLLSSSAPTPTTVITATVNATDPEGDALSYAYTWSVTRRDALTNTPTVIPLTNVPSGPSASNVLDLSTVDVQAGDLLSVGVQVSDGQLTVSSTPVTVLVKSA
jgi:cyclophilin family peptidyl-prolyl cis-trans isomerase